MSLQTHHLDSDRFHVVSMWNPRGVFVGLLPSFFFFFFEKIKCLNRAKSIMIIYKPNNICKKYDFVKKKRFFIKFHHSSENGQIFYIVESIFLSEIPVPFFNANNFCRIPSSVNNSIFFRYFVM